MTTQSLQPHRTASERRPLPSGFVAGLLIIVAGAMQGDGALISAAYREASPVSDDQLSFPWAGTTAVTTSLIWGITQVLLVVGLASVLRSGVAPTRAGRAGGRLAVAGAALYVVAHALSLVGYDAAMDEPIAVVVLVCFGVGTVLTAVGLIIAGVVARRAAVWTGWRRHTLLALGLWMVAMLPLQFTAALPIAVGIYAVAVIALGLALVVEVLVGNYLE